MSWKKVKLSEFLIPREFRFKPNAKEIKNLKRIDKIKFDGNIFLSNKPSRTDMILIKNGDLVISGINVEKGAIAIYEGKEDVTATIHYSNYVYYKNKIDIDFLKIFLKSPEFLNAIKEQVPGGIKTEIKPKHLLRLEVVIPEIDEQKIICKNYSSFEDLNKNIISEIESQNSLISQLRQAYLREAMQGKLVSQDPKDEPASVLLEKIKAEKERFIKEGKLKKQKSLSEIKTEEIPFQTDIKSTFIRLQDICYIEKGNIGIKKAQEGNYPLVTLSEERLTHSDYAFDCKAVVLPLISSAGHGKAEMKRMHYQEGKFSIGSILCGVYPFNYELFNARFLYEYLNNYKQDFFVRKMKGAANVSLKTSSIAETPIPLVPISIQNKFDKLMQLCDDLEKNINQSKEQTDMLLKTVLREALEAN